MQFAALLAVEATGDEMLPPLHLQGLARHHAYACRLGHFVVGHLQFGRRSLGVAKLQYAVRQALAARHLPASDFPGLGIDGYDGLGLAPASRGAHGYERLHGQRLLGRYSCVLALEEYSLGQVGQCPHVQLVGTADAGGFGHKLQGSHSSPAYERKNVERGDLLRAKAALYAPALKHLVAPGVGQRVGEKRRQLAVDLRFPVAHDGAMVGCRLDGGQERERVEASAKERGVVLEKRNASPCVPEQAADLLVPEHDLECTCRHGFLCLMRCTFFSFLIR